MKKVAVVILNYNGRKFLEQFLPNVIENTDGELADIVVADNASTDGSVDFMRERFPDIRLIVNDFNGGFATGYNLALRQIEAEYFVLLNSDIEVTPHWIEPVIELMDSDPKIAACQPKILSYFEKDKFEYAGAAGGFIDKYGYPFCRGRLFQHLEEDHGQYDEAMEVFWATGACMFVRADLYLQKDGLDDSFFAHMEEIDFCWRMKNLGYKIYCCPQSRIYHIGGGTLPKSSSRKTYLNFRNNLSLLYKNLPSNRVFWTIAYRIFLDWVAAFKFLCSGGLKDFWAVIRAHFAFYRRIPSLRKKRGEILIRQVGQMYQRNIVFENFLRGKKTFVELDPEQFTHA
ncbi:MAG: glycosyltransferase family 2 protein [Bacteroidales bacterium]|nr:glycosyltransferase family 2 protein [Bacteroidales bacterium]MBR4148481.1 glycosyltransferase family 2 protein [Bacteroidales bacterium]